MSPGGWWEIGGGGGGGGGGGVKSCACVFVCVLCLYVVWCCVGDGGGCFHLLALRQDTRPGDKVKVNNKQP